MPDKSPLNRPGIYRITCRSNGRVYVGSAANIRKRWKLHRTHLRMGVHHNRPLQNAWRKYGEADFDFDLLEFCEEAQLAECEQVWMDRLHAYTRRHGFNVLAKAYTSVGLKHSDSTRAKLSEIARERGAARHLVAWNKARIGMPSLSRGTTGQKWSDERKAAASAARKGSKPWNVGVPMADEVKVRVATSVRANRRVISDEVRARIIKLRSEGMSYSQIATETGVSLSQCAKIVSGKDYRYPKK